MFIDVKRLGAAVFVICCATFARAEPALAQFGRLDEASAGWRPQASRGGITLERRPVQGSPFYEYRVVVDLPVEPSFVADQIWAALHEGDMYDLKRRLTLKADVDEMVLYDQIRVPVVNDRDYTIRVRRLRDPARRCTQFRCETANELGPPPASGHVRMPMIRAGWATEPGPRGGTRLTHYAYSEPGGSVAAFLVHDGQANHSLNDVLHMIDRLKRLSGQ